VRLPRRPAVAGASGRRASALRRQSGSPVSAGRRQDRGGGQGGDGMTDILMPALSPTMEEGVLSKWHVKVGDTVKAGDVIAEIETDKATMEVEAVDEGEVTDILVGE